MFKKLYNLLFPAKTPVEIGQIWQSKPGEWLSEKPELFMITDMTRNGKFVYLVRVVEKGVKQYPPTHGGVHTQRPSVSCLRKEYTLTDYNWEDFE